MPAGGWSQSRPSPSPIGVVTVTPGSQKRPGRFSCRRLAQGPTDQLSRGASRIRICFKEQSSVWGGGDLWDDLWGDPDQGVAPPAHRHPQITPESPPPLWPLPLSNASVAPQHPGKGRPGPRWPAPAPGLPSHWTCLSPHGHLCPGRLWNIQVLPLLPGQPPPGSHLSDSTPPLFLLFLGPSSRLLAHSPLWPTGALGCSPILP